MGSTPAEDHRRPPGLRLAFLGTPDFSVPALAALAEAGHQIVAVYSQPPRPAGRGHKTKASPVEAFAEARGWPVRTPHGLRTADEAEAFAALELDAAVVVAYGLMLPLPILEAPRLGCFNIHASLLPRWRGAAPIQRAILAGDPESGVTIMKMEEGLDSGPMLLRRALPIRSDTTGEVLHDELAALGAEAIVEALALMAADPNRVLQPQPAAGITYASKLKKAEGELDWRRPAEELERLVRAFTPWPGACFRHDGVVIKVLGAEVTAEKGPPGLLLEGSSQSRLTVACGDGALRLVEVQRPGKRPMAAAEFLRGFDLAPGTQLSCPATS